MGYDGRKEIYFKALMKEIWGFIQLLKVYQFCFASVFSKEDLNIHLKITNEFIKIPSMEAYDIDLIKKCLNKFNKVLVSTGALKKANLI